MNVIQSSFNTMSTQEFINAMATDYDTYHDRLYIHGKIHAYAIANNKDVDWEVHIFDLVCS